MNFKSLFKILDAFTLSKGVSLLIKSAYAVESGDSVPSDVNFQQKESSVVVSYDFLYESIAISAVTKLNRFKKKEWNVARNGDVVELEVPLRSEEQDTDSNLVKKIKEFYRGEDLFIVLDDGDINNVELNVDVLSKESFEESMKSAGLSFELDENNTDDRIAAYYVWDPE